MIGRLAAISLVLSWTGSSWAWVNPSAQQQQQHRKVTSLNGSPLSRNDFFQSVVGTALVGAGVLTTSFVTTAGPAWAADKVTLPSGVSYVVTQAGTGPKPEIGELAAIRFAAYYGDIKIDDLFQTPEPYYTRIGSGGLLKGVEEVLPLMVVGDRWTVTIPGNLAFGEKGRKASAGKPRIAPNAEIVFDVEMVGLPGKEMELIELIGDD